MFRRRRGRRRAQEIPQASLPDLAFLLLIFFITSADVPMEHGLPLVLPSSQKSAVVQVEPSEVFRIRAYPGARVTVDDEPIAVEALGALLVQRNQQRRSQGEADLIVVVETHPEAAYQLTVQVLDQIRLADSRRISLRLLEGS